MSQCKYIKDGEYSFNEGDILGAGSFGKVYKGYSHKNNKSVAIKQMSFELMSKHGEEIKASICKRVLT